MSYSKQDMKKHVDNKNCANTKKSKSDGSDICPLCLNVVMKKATDWHKHLVKDTCPGNERN